MSDNCKWGSGSYGQSGKGVKDEVSNYKTSMLRYCRFLLLLTLSLMNYINAMVMFFRLQNLLSEHLVGQHIAQDLVVRAVRGHARFC